MPKVNRYDVYDDGKLIMQNATRGEIVDRINCSTINIPNYIDRNNKYKDRYTFKYSETDPETKMDSAFAREWEATVALFKNVIWVKTGGKKLMVPRLEGR